MTDNHWKLLEPIGLQRFPKFLQPDDRCYFAREYQAGRRFNSCEANDLILNFKKDPSRRGKSEWRYKEKAITQFANELSMFVENAHVTVCPIPTSKCKSDPDYDDRFEQTLEALKPLCPNIAVDFPIVRRETTQALHTGCRRSIDQVYDTLEFVGFSTTPYFVVLIDDVITLGTSYKACQRHILEANQSVKVFGAFWAMAVWPDEPDIDASGVDISKFFSSQRPPS